MADPTPTYDQVLNAVIEQLQAGAITATILHFEDRHVNEAELLREYRGNTTDFETELVLIEADVESVEGKSHGENYSIYKIQLRHLYTRQDEEEISRIAKKRAEIIRGILEANTAVFRIGGQVPLLTPETVTLRGAFVTRDDSRYYESNLTLDVEARRWQ